MSIAVSVENSQNSGNLSNLLILHEIFCSIFLVFSRFFQSHTLTLQATLALAVRAHRVPFVPAHTSWPTKLHRSMIRAMHRSVKRLAISKTYQFLKPISFSWVDFSHLANILDLCSTASTRIVWTLCQASTSESWKAAKTRSHRNDRISRNAKAHLALIEFIAAREHSSTPQSWKCA